MLNVNSYNVKYRVFVCVAHKLIPFHKTRRSQSPPGGPIPCWHIVAWFGTTAYPLSLSYDRCLALPCLARPCRAPPSPAMDASASFPPTSCAGGGIRKLLSRVLLRACLGTHVAAQSPFRAFARPAVPTRPVSTSPHFLPSRASRSQRLALAVLVLVGASSVRFQLSAGRCRATRLPRAS